MKRTLTPELMDAPDVPRPQLAGALAFLRMVNRRWGGSRALISHLRRWSARWPARRPVTLLDIATGSADIPLAARRWALARGHDLRVTAVDLHEATLELAREHLDLAARAEPEVARGITLLRADARNLREHFAPASFDYVHAALFLHHLPDIEALTVLAQMDALARAGIVWSDLNRSRLHRALIEPSIWFAPPIVRHDGRVSVEGAFTRSEAEQMARRVGINYAPYHRPPLWYRFTLAGEKPGCWNTT
ncbi:MAG: methyltransferase domain-containing protein [Planctomycetota bacterium]|nr:methyltransferase domain-containing protein [Planctomycetota bacterium]